MNLNAVEREVKRIKDKIIELDSKQFEIVLEKSALENQLIGLETALKLVQKPCSPISKTHELRTDSEIFKVQTILKNHSSSMHLDQILKELGFENNRNKKLSLRGTIGSYPHLFRKVLPNTFELIKNEPNTPEQDNGPK